MNSKRRGRQNGGAGGEGPQLSDDLGERFDQLTADLHYGHSALVDTRYNS
jgi:hypothetical protein